MINNQKSGNNSNNYQSENLTINNNLTVLYSIEEVARKLLDSAFGELPDDTKQLISSNQKSYFQVLSELLKQIVIQGEDLKKIINDPDFQFISKNALISASRSPSIELHKNLSSLVIQRINSSNDDLKRIVYNEAITTINKLTTNQLKIITLCFLFKYIANDGITSWQTYVDYLNAEFKPFLNFKNTIAEFQHIAYTSCGSIGITSKSGLKVHKENYTFLFLNLIEKSEIDNLNLDNTIKQKLVTVDPKEDKYIINFLNKHSLQNFLKENNINEETIKKISSICMHHIKDDQEIKIKIAQEANIDKNLLEPWADHSNVSFLSLTSVGIVIAATYFEQITGDKIDIDDWIN